MDSALIRFHCSILFKRTQALNFMKFLMIW
nr:MAG TPA: hypothetical protein [Bacteriophage sp.]